MEIVDATLREDYEPTSEEVALVVGALSHNEKKWRDRHGMLKLEGYELRPRLRPGWKPSWLESGADPLDCEDGEILPVGCFVDQNIRHCDKLVATLQACGCYPRGYW